MAIGIRDSKLYIEKDVMITWVLEDKIKLLKEALKYCKHSKRKHVIKRDLEIWIELYENRNYYFDKK